MIGLPLEPCKDGIETFELEIHEVFVTNIFPFIKKGGLSSNLPQRDIDRAFTEFCIPQINILSPRLIICCGAKVFKAAINHFIIVRQTKHPVGQRFKIAEMTFCYQRHTGAPATNTTGGIDMAITNKQQNKYLSLILFSSQSRERRMNEAPNSTNA